MDFHHLASYGKRKRDDEITGVSIVSETEINHDGNIIDLRKGCVVRKNKTADYGYARDGRVVRTVGEDRVVIHPDGKQVKLAIDTADVNDPIFFDGAVLLEDYHHRKEAAVFDTTTGALRARLEGHARDDYGLFGPWLHASDRTTLWSSDGKTIRRFDIATVRETLAIPIDKKLRSLMLATTPSGDVVTTLRPAKGDRDDDRLVLLDQTGKEKAVAKLKVYMRFDRVGDNIVVFEDATERFAILDSALKEVASVPMPIKENYAEIVPLWSGKEWIAVDGHNQFHHFGPANLKPAGAAAAEKKPAKKK